MLKRAGILALLLTLGLVVAQAGESRRPGATEDWQGLPAMPQVAQQCGKKRYCKQMRSCKEACYYFLKCGLSKLDRDNDGIPCENVCSRPCKRRG